MMTLTLMVVLHYVEVGMNNEKNKKRRIIDENKRRIHNKTNQKSTA
jgi:hypothetical protein